MTLPNWGELTKSQIDPQLIEEAIESMIADHNNDPEAHLEEGQSLQSHKASSIIDHLAESIINDKIRKNEITPDQLKYYNHFQFYGIQTLDCWDKDLVGSGSDVYLEGYGRFSVEAGDVAGAEACSRLSPVYTGMLNSAEPIIEFIGEDVGGEDMCDIAMCLGYENPFTTTEPCVGIKYKNADNKLYAFVVYKIGATPTYYEYEISNNYFQQATYRIECDDTAKTIKWFINGVLKYTYDYTGKTIFSSGNTYMAFKVDRVNTGDTAIFAVWNLFMTSRY